MHLPDGTRLAGAILRAGGVALNNRSVVGNAAWLDRKSLRLRPNWPGASVVLVVAEGAALHERIGMQVSSASQASLVLLSGHRLLQNGESSLQGDGGDFGSAWVARPDGCFAPRLFCACSHPAS